MMAENIRLSAEQRSNITDILTAHAQLKHFTTLGTDLPAIQGKVKVIEAVLCLVEEGHLDLSKFTSWLALHQINGNNQFYIFELNEHSITEASMMSIQTVVSDITMINKATLDKTVLINFVHDHSKQRGVFTFLSPAEVFKKVKINEVTQQTVVEKQLYYAHVIVDYGLNNIVISINPTANLIAVDKTSKDKNGFEPIAYHYLLAVKDIIGQFTIKTSRWIPEALDLLAEEATFHNNPEITAEYMKAVPLIDETVARLLENFALDDPSDFAYVSEELKQAFENILIDKYGVIKDTIDSYRVFELKGDQTNSFVYVGAKTSYLNEGRAAKVAKATRSNADLTLLGIECTVNKEMYRFYISSGPDYYLIKSNTNKFTYEEVIHNVVIKLDQYKRQIQSRAISASTD